MLVATIAPRWARFYELFGLELPWGTYRTLQAGQALGSPTGIFFVAVALGLGLLPLRLARGSPALAWWFGIGALVATCAGVFAWLLLEVPLASLHFSSFGPPSPFQLSLQARPGRYLAMLVFGLLPELGGGWLCVVAPILAWRWVRATRQVSRSPRGSLPVEALRALVVCSLPALVLGTLAFAVGRLGYAHDGLVVAPSYAGAGTVALVVYGAALWLRLRRPSPEELSAPSPPT